MRVDVERGARRRRLALVVAGLALAIILALANAHLVSVAIGSQPDCVPHLKMPDGAQGTYRAAKSAC